MLLLPKEPVTRDSMTTEEFNAVMETGLLQAKSNQSRPAFPFSEKDTHYLKFEVQYIFSHMFKDLHSPDNSLNWTLFYKRIAFILILT